jgi:YaaC-like Protein
MARVITTENPSLDVRRYLRHWADGGFVADQLKEQHPGMGSDPRRTRGKQVARLVHQGLAFLESAEGSSVLTKPLTVFYGAENLAKAMCICRDPLLGTNDIRYHGLGGDRETKRYSIKNLSCRVYAPRKDVWSNFFKRFNGDRYRVTIQQAAMTATYDSQEVYATKPLAAKAEIQLGDLLRHLPELRDDVRLAGWGHSHTVRASDLRLVVDEGPPRTQTVSFTLRHDLYPPAKEMIIDRESDLLKKYDRVRDQLDVLEYRQGPTEDPITTPGVRLDVFGDLFMDFARGTRVFGEPVLYLAALFILSDVARYQPEHWLRLLEDHPAEAILIERFLDIAGRKLPNVVLNELHQQLFLFRLAR